MTRVDVDKTPLGQSAGAMGYYLAGLFALNSGIVDSQIVNWLLVVVGAILSLYGLMLLLDPILRVSTRVPQPIRMQVVVALLSICGAQLIVAATYGLLFMILSLIFIAGFVAVILLTSFSVLRTKGQLLTVFVTLLVVGLIQFLFVDRSLRWDRWDLYFILVLDLVILGRLVRLVMESKRGRARSVKSLEEGV